MGLQNVTLMSFNRGRISRLALARTDVKRIALSSETMTNWIARVMGGMMLRPGWGYLNTIPSTPYFIPFVFSTSDTAMIEFTDQLMRVWVNETPINRVAVTTAVTNGNFDTDLSGWTNSDEAGGTSAWVTGGYMGLTGSGTAAAIRDQQLTVLLVDSGKEHALRINVQRGPVSFRLGTTQGNDDLISETDLGTGAHSLAFTPNGGPVWIRFFSRLKRQVLVADCNIEAAGIMTLPSPYTAATTSKVRYDESADVMYLSNGGGYQQRKIERRSTNSWSIVRYQANDGPFRSDNAGPITITPSALSGNVTLTASAALFKSTQAPSTNNDGALFRISSDGQTVTVTVTAQNQFSSAIKVEGVNTQRVFSIVLSALSASGSTITLQRSLVGDSGPWTDVKTWVADTTETFDDLLDNQTAWYRIGCKTGGYAAGTIVCTLNYTVGSIDGVVRITGFTSSTSVTAEVISDLGGISATDNWAEGEWSDRRGWPSSGKLYEGRMAWAGKGGFWDSISDGFESFDDTVTGDAGIINKNIGSGPVDNVNWILALARLILGTDAAEMSCKSTVLNDPLTPTNINIKPDSTQGSANVDAARIDTKGYFVQNGGTRVFELDRQNGVDYTPDDLTKLIPEICAAGAVKILVQRKPDTRIHVILSDGTVAMAVIDRVENVLCWFNVQTRTGDLVEDGIIMPPSSSSGEDRVYYATKRVVNGATVRFLEKWALESECVGGTTNKQADAFVTYTAANVAGSTISGFSHLAGESVVVWDNGKCLRDANDDIATFVVNGGGQITVTNHGASYVPTQGMAGLGYTAQWKSTKLAYAGGADSPLNQQKIIEHLGVIMDRTHHRGLKYGPSFTQLEPMPLVEDGTDVVEDTVWDQYDKKPFEFEGEWSPDSRLCLQAQAPRNCTLLAATIPVEEHQ